MWQRLRAAALQLTLWPSAEPAAEPAAEHLSARLYRLGLPRQVSVRTHRNRSVMVSLVRGKLRVHEGYGHAPDAVLAAIVKFLRPGVRRDERLRARRLLLEFPADQHVPSRERPPRRLEPARPGDAHLLTLLHELHETLNTRYFGGRLSRIPIRLSSRMRTRLGELRLDLRTGQALEIVLSRWHIRRDGWQESEQTLLHEMVHQWQAESGASVDHGAAFRRKAREVGIDPRAVRRD